MKKSFSICIGILSFTLSFIGVARSNPTTQATAPIEMVSTFNNPLVGHWKLNKQHCLISGKDLSAGSATSDIIFHSDMSWESHLVSKWEDGSSCEGTKSGHYLADPKHIVIDLEKAEFKGEGCSTPDFEVPTLRMLTHEVSLSKVLGDEVAFYDFPQEAKFVEGCGNEKDMLRVVYDKVAEQTTH